MQTPDPAKTDAQSVAPEAAANDAAQGNPIIENTDDRVAAAEAKAAENYDQFLRARAEMENVRRRAQEDIAKAHKFAIESFATGLLPVKDSLEMTLAADAATLETIRSGVELTLKQLAGLFEKSGVREVNPAGEKFDPHRHQAISMLPSDKEPNTVINVLQKGYVLNERVIRPAMVTVARAPDQAQ